MDNYILLDNIITPYGTSRLYECVSVEVANRIIDNLRNKGYKIVYADVFEPAFHNELYPYCLDITLE